MKTALLITLIAISAGSLFAQDSTVTFDLVYQGEFPVSLWGRQFKSAHLVKDQPDYLITLDSAGFDAYCFDSTTWREVAATPFKQDSITRINNQPTWTVGDLDNDGADEIVTWSERMVVQFKLKERNFIRGEYPMPFYIQQGVMGDINTDQLSELVVFGFDSALYTIYSGEAVGHGLALFVLRVDSGSMRILWSDGCRLGYFDSAVVPPDRLHFIAPFTSRDQNQLIITASQSDMSPSYYHILAWDREHLRRTEEFHLINGHKVGELAWMNPHKPKFKGDKSTRPAPEYPFSCGGIVPIIYNGKSAVIDNEYDKGGIASVLLQPEDDHFKLLRIIFKDSNPYAGASLWMDPDGKGKGLLGSAYRPYKSGDRPEKMNWLYSFYRMH